jgi:hypothetical protein
MPGIRWDILSCDDQFVYLRDMVFDRDGNIQKNGNPHLFSLTDLLDDEWAHRAYWIFGTRCSLSTGCSGRDKNLLYGRLIVFDDSTIYGYGRARVHWSNQIQDGPCRAFAVKRDDRSAVWSEPLPIQVRAMVLADRALFMAGPSAKVIHGVTESVESEGAVLLVISAIDGSELARHQLTCSPVFDGIAVANNCLYLSLEDSSVLCLSGD